ncbi:MAG: CHAT domain-containing tetratricopeptide repeat protein [Acidobacteriaceae bacterium]
MQCAGAGKRVYYTHQRHHHAAFLAGTLLSFAVIIGCHSPTRQSPEAAYRHIDREFRRGNLGRAQLDAAKARKRFSRRSGTWDIRFRLLEAEILTYQGSSQNVIRLLDSDPPRHRTAANTEIKRQLLLSLAHTRLGQPQLSDLELQQAQRLSGASHSSLHGEVLQTEGLVEIHRDQVAKAQDSFASSLDFARRHGDKFLETADLLNLGTVALHTEEYGEALDRFKAASLIAQSIQARLALELALGNAGWAYYKLGDFERSLSNFQQAEQQAKRLGSTHDQIVWSTNTGLSFYRLGNLKAAEANYRRALKAAVADDDKEWIVYSHTQLGFLFFQRRQFNSAQRQCDDALQAARSWGDKSVVALDAVFLQGLLAARSTNGAEAKRLLMQVYHDPMTMPSLREEVENAIARVYAQHNRPHLAEAWYRKSIATFEAQRSSLKEDELKLPFFANADALFKDYAQFLIESHRSTEALQLLELGRAQTLEDGLGYADNLPQLWQKGAVNAQAVARKRDATILFYALGPERSYLWAINAHHTRLFVLPPQSAIDSNVEKYQKAILQSSDPIRQRNEAARYLYNTLVAPVAPAIRKGSKVVLIPDGSLDELNFETLLVPGNTGFHYWIEDVTVVNANAMRLIARPASRSSETATKDLLLIGDPVSPGPDYPKLRNASAEIRSVERHFPTGSEVVLTRAQAIPAAYSASRPEQFSYIHFVAHGTASRLRPLDSAVVLSASPGHSDIFKLYGRDIVHLPLHAKLVTISTCYGSGLRAYAGEGLVGLSWAFLRAGAQNVIGALWEANDASTPLLMDRLYGEIQSGNAPDVALRDAKLSLIHSQTIYRKPLYWATFQLYAGG